MANVVQNELERLLPVFESAEKFKLLTPKEIRCVISKCKEFEYRLRKKLGQKSVYVAYIQYLIDFTNLIYHRRGVIKFTKHKEEVEKLVFTKITSLFRMACKRYPSDINLYLSWIQFAKMKKLFQTVSRVYFALLQVHSNNPDLWILAAEFEMNQNKNVDNARALLQRSLRFNPKSEKLWLELFRLELLFIDKMFKRLSILGEKEEKPEPIPNEDVILDGKLAILVFKQSMREITEASLCLQFIQLAKTVLLPCTPFLIAEIRNFLEQNFPKSEEKYECLIRLQFEEESEEIFKKHQINTAELQEKMQNLVQKLCDLYEKACESLQTSKMYSMYFDFLVENFDSSSSEEKFNNLHGKLLEVSAKKNMLPESCFKHWSNLCLNLNQRQQALQCGMENYPKSLSLRLDYLKYLIEMGDKRKSIMKAFNEAFEQIPEKESLDLWKLALQWSLIEYPEKVEKLFETSFLRDASISSTTKMLYLEYTFTGKGIEETRAIFKKLCQAKPNNWEFYQTYLRIENSSCEPNESAIRKCFEHAALEHGTENVDMWCEYFKFETPKKPQEASQIYSRATRALKNSNLVEDFVRRHVIVP